MSLERVGRLLLALAGALGVVGMALADSRAQFGRYLAPSGCLVMVGLALLLLAPRPAVRSSDRVTAAPNRVPRQRTAVPPRPAVEPRPAVDAGRTGDAVPTGSTRAA